MYDFHHQTCLVIGVSTRDAYGCLLLETPTDKVLQQWSVAFFANFFFPLNTEGLAQPRRLVLRHIPDTPQLPARELNLVFASRTACSRMTWTAMDIDIDLLRSMRKNIGDDEQ